MGATDGEPDQHPDGGRPDPSVRTTALPMPALSAYHLDSTDRDQGSRRLLSELVGTFCLVLVAAGGPTLAAATGSTLGLAALVTAPGIALVGLIYTFGPASGAHFNPAVTLAFAMRKDFPWYRVPGYLLAQLAGATLAAAGLRAMFGPVGHLGATIPLASAGDLRSLAAEVALTAVLVSIILGTAHDAKIVGHNGALAVGGWVAAAGLFAAPLSGASMNPARSLGPDVVRGDLTSAWIYVVGPIAGGLLAVGLANALRGPSSPAAREAAQGELARIRSGQDDVF